MSTAALVIEGLTPEGAQFAQAWSRWRGGRRLPRRSDMQLADIKGLLPMVTLLEMRGPAEVVFRVAGSRLRDYLGFDLTGANYIDLAPEQFRPGRLWRIEQEISYPCGALFCYPHRFPSGHVAPAETLSLPLEDDRPDRPPMMLSVITPLAQHRLEEPAAGGTPEIFVADQFAFIDIGAGIPGRILP